MFILFILFILHMALPPRLDKNNLIIMLIRALSNFELKAIIHELVANIPSAQVELFWYLKTQVEMNYAVPN